MKESKKLISMAIGGLVIVNAALAAAIYTRTAEPPVYAQAAGGRVDVLTISSHYTNPVGPGAILMLDSHSGQLILLRPNINGNAATSLDSRNCADDVGRAGH